MASAFPFLPYSIEPEPFLRSTVHDCGYLPLDSATSKWYTNPTFLTTSAPCSLRKGFILSKQAAVFNGILQKGELIITMTYRQID